MEIVDKLVEAYKAGGRTGKVQFELETHLDYFQKATFARAMDLPRDKNLLERIAFAFGYKMGYGPLSEDN